MKLILNKTRGLLLTVVILGVLGLAAGNSMASDPTDNDLLQSISSTTVVLPTTLKVILIQFNDVKWDQYWDYGMSQWRPYTYKHKKAAFDSLLASLGIYYVENGDKAPVFGSFKDYFWENSRHTYSPTVTILNSTDANGYPVWVNLPNNKSTYNMDNIILAADAAASNPPYNLDISRDTYVKLCYIYAGHFMAAINAFADYYDNVMGVPERWRPGDRTSDETVNDRRTHIGWFCHEFGHLMGADHSHPSVTRWDLMRSGHKNGTEEANRPASMNPWFLFKSSWADTIQLNNDLLDADLVYNTSPTLPSTYYVRKIPNSNEQFLVENRQLTNTYDQSLPPAVVIPPKSGGILIWRIRGEGLTDSQTDLIEADNDPSEATMENMAEDVFRPDGSYPYHKIFDYSSPANLKLNDGSLSHFAVDDYLANGNPITVDFKVHCLYTNSSVATAYNNSRKLVRDSNGKYHLLYEAEGEIYYQYSPDGGTTWSGYKRLSPGTGNRKYPCIAERSGNLYVVWQWYWYDVNSHYIYFCRSTSGGLGWSSAKLIASNVGISDPLPVIASPATNELMTVYRIGNKLRWKRSTDDGSTWPISGTISAGSDENLNSPSLTATILPWATGVTGLAYATKEIPNASHIITRYYYAGGPWSSANNISSSMPIPRFHIVAILRPITSTWPGMPIVPTPTPALLFIAWARPGALAVSIGYSSIRVKIGRASAV